jgi:hypothetical protein
VTIPPVDTTAERVARNESVFRDANERIEAAADDMEHLDEVPLICECPIQSCTELVRVSREDYELARSDGAWFLVAEGHEVVTFDGLEIARVKYRRDGFTIMEKVGETGEVARRLDPRTVERSS